MQVTITTEVRTCYDCPHFTQTMEGPTCYEGMFYVFPEGRTGIHPDCPVKLDQEEEKRKKEQFCPA